MNILNLIGLVMGYLGSIMLSMGLFKSKQELIDEEKPFWGPNPFKMRSTMRSHWLGVAGVAFLVAGFATTTVAIAFSTVLRIDNVNLAMSVIALLIVTAYSIILLALKAKKRAHLDAKSRYYFNELIKEVRELKNKYEKEPVITTQDGTLDDLKKQHSQQFSKNLNDLKPDDKKAIEKLISSIDKAEQFADITTALEEFLIEQDPENQ